MATGALRFWKDGRDVPDVMLGLFDYREGFNLSLRVNFVDGGEESEGLIFTGSEGTMEIGGGPLRSAAYHIKKRLAIRSAPTLRRCRSNSRRIRSQISRARAPATLGGAEKFAAPEGYADNYDHFKNFFHSVRTRKQPCRRRRFRISVQPAQHCSAM